MKLSPMMRATPIVAEQFPQRARDGADNVLFKDRSDGLARLLITGANSPASLSQVTAEFLVDDDLANGSRTRPAIRRLRLTTGRAL